MSHRVCHVNFFKTSPERCISVGFHRFYLRKCMFCRAVTSTAPFQVSSWCQGAWTSPGYHKGKAKKSPRPDHIKYINHHDFRRKLLFNLFGGGYSMVQQHSHMYIIYILMMSILQINVYYVLLIPSPSHQKTQTYWDTPVVPAEKIDVLSLCAFSYLSLAVLHNYIIYCKKCASSSLIWINNVRLLKIEGPVWYTIYHHLPVVKGVSPNPSISQPTNRKRTSMIWRVPSGKLT